MLRSESDLQGALSAQDAGRSRVWRTRDCAIVAIKLLKGLNNLIAGVSRSNNILIPKMHTINKNDRTTSNALHPCRMPDTSFCQVQLEPNVTDRRECKVTLRQLTGLAYPVVRI